MRRLIAPLAARWRRAAEGGGADADDRGAAVGVHELHVLRGRLQHALGELPLEQDHRPHARIRSVTTMTPDARMSSIGLEKRQICLCQFIFFVLLLFVCVITASTMCQNA